MSTLPVETFRPPWLDDARAQWLPREGHVEPLRVTAWMRSPVAFDRDDGLRLEGALGWVAVAMTTGLPPPEAFAGQSHQAFTDVPVPIADEVIHGWRIAMASDAVLPPVAVEVVRKRRKKTHAEALALNKVQTTGGPWKMLDIPVSAWASPVLEWFVMGDAERLEALLRELHGLGRGRSGGLGNVDAWSVEVDERARTRWRERPLPHHAGATYDDARVMRRCAVRAPFWHPHARTVAACPVVSP